MLDQTQLQAVAKILADGYYGSFMSAIGCALLLADNGNKEKLYAAFGEVFEQVHTNAMVDAEKR